MDILFENVSHTYQAGLPFAHTALNHVSLKMKPHSVTAIIGKTGSGKSTLVQHLNALLKPTEGRIRLGTRVIESQTSERYLKDLRKQVGTVFQFPEAQLFEQTVLKDITFGPKNYGASEQEAEAIARKVLPLVGLDDSYLSLSPFELSGGEQRRVAIAGVLALEPEVLVLDEPTAGLDPKGQKETMEMFYRLNQTYKTTIILVTHQMEHVVEYAEDVIVLSEGSVMKQGPPNEIFKDAGILRALDLDLPETIAFAQELNQTYNWRLNTNSVTTDELAEHIKAFFKKTEGEIL